MPRNRSRCGKSWTKSRTVGLVSAMPLQHSYTQVQLFQWSPPLAVAVDTRLTCEACYVAIPTAGFYVSYSFHFLSLQSLNLRYVAGALIQIWELLTDWCTRARLPTTPFGCPARTYPSLADWIWALARKLLSPLI